MTSLGIAFSKSFNAAVVILLFFGTVRERSVLMDLIWAIPASVILGTPRKI